MDLNKAMIIGRLTRDPELRNLPSGVAVANFSIATNFIYTDQAGVKQQKVEYHDIVMWRRLAEIASQYLKKGAKVYIEGRLQTRVWDDPNGFKRSKTEIVADNMIMLDRPAASRDNDFASPPFGVSRETSEPSFQKGVTDSASSPVRPFKKDANDATNEWPKTRPDEELPTIDITEEGDEAEEVKIEDIPF